VDANNAGAAVSYRWSVFKRGAEKTIGTAPVFSWDPSSAIAINDNFELRLYGSDARAQTTMKSMQCQAYPPTVESREYVLAGF